MSSRTVGIDLGSVKSVAAYVAGDAPNTVVIANNELSKIDTPSMVSFAGARRIVGEAAADQLRVNCANTILDLVRLTGATLEEYRASSRGRALFSVVEDETTGRLHVEVSFLGKPTRFPTEHVTAMLLRKLYADATRGMEEGTEVSVSVAVPPAFTAQQRQALQDAAALAGLPQPVQLVDSVSAMAAAHLVKHQERRPAAGAAPEHVLFVSVGHAFTCAGVAAMSHTGARVLSSVCDASLGASNVDYALLKMCRDELKERHGIELDVASKRGMRVLRECTKAKKILSTIPSTVMELENVAPDRDVRVTVTRERVEAAIKDDATTLGALLTKALEDAGVEGGDLRCVELLGGGTRVPLFKQTIADTVGADLAFTLDSTAGVAQGAALLQCRRRQANARMLQAALTKAQAAMQAEAAKAAAAKAAAEAEAAAAAAKVAAAEAATEAAADAGAAKPDTAAPAEAGAAAAETEAETDAATGSGDVTGAADTAGAEAGSGAGAGAGAGAEPTEEELQAKFDAEELENKFVVGDFTAQGAATVPRMSAEELAVVEKLEAEIAEAEAAEVALAQARNDLESHVLRMRSNMRDSELMDEEVVGPMLMAAEDFLYEDKTAAELTARLAELTAELEAAAPEYFAEEERKKRQVEAELEAQAKLADAQHQAEVEAGTADDHDRRRMKKADRLRLMLKNKAEGNELFGDGNHKAAAIRYVKALNHGSKFFDLSDEDKKEVDAAKLSCHLNLAMCYLKLEAWRKAFEAARCALEIDPVNVKALYRQGTAAWEMKQVDKAEACVEAALAVDETSKPVLRLQKKVKRHRLREAQRRKKMAKAMFG